MRIEPVLQDAERRELPLLAHSAFQGDAPPEELVAGLPSVHQGTVRRAWTSGEFRGREDQSLLLHTPEGEEGPERFLILGAGEEDKASAETVRRLAARAVRRTQELSLPFLGFRLPKLSGLSDEEQAQAASEGAVLAEWRFLELQTPKEPAPTPVESFGLVGGGEEEVRRGAEVGRIVADAENFARTLQNRPGNVATPAHLAEIAQEVGAQGAMEVTILGPKELEEEGMGALLAVSQGSTQEPRLIVLEHRGGDQGEAPVALVGKGLTFDSGGISIKPSSGMEDMKYDMSGGAAVLAAMKGVAELGLPMNVLGVVPSAENLPSGTAVKPGDVIRTRSGKAVEVINTDAEGRLILADALSYIGDREPAAIVDCATLTGACVVALGHHAAAVLGTDEDLISALREAGDRSGERCWPLPLWPEYRTQLDSKVADLKNVGGRPAGTITAAHFLREFVGEIPWAHLDVAGTAYGEGKLPYRRDGGFGFPTRLLLEWLRSRTR